MILREPALGSLCHIYRGTPAITVMATVGTTAIRVMAIVGMIATAVMDVNVTL